MTSTTPYNLRECKPTPTLADLEIHVTADTCSPPAADARRLALEAIATLVHVKRMTAEQLLRRAEVPDDLIRRFLGEKDPVTGEKRSKREAGALVLDELARRGGENDVVRRLVAVAASRGAFPLAP